MRPGLTPSIQLLDPYGSGRPMSNPRDRRWVSFPIGFWSHGWLLHLSPVAIAVLFALREFLGGSKVPRYMLRDRRASYGLSHDTWTRGRQELEKAGLLTVTRVPQGDDYAYNRLRNSYWLVIDPLNGAVPLKRSELRSKAPAPKFQPDHHGRCDRSCPERARVRHPASGAVRPVQVGRPAGCGRRLRTDVALLGVHHQARPRAHAQPAAGLLTVPWQGGGLAWSQGGPPRRPRRRRCAPRRSTCRRRGPGLPAATGGAR
jgi:hypothetical protein